jgi:hypothetical protein
MANRWEKLTEEAGEKTDRLRVKGGWLYRTRTISTGHSYPAMAFVPDHSVEPTMALPIESREGDQRPDA